MVTSKRENPVNSTDQVDIVAAVRTLCQATAGAGDATLEGEAILDIVRPLGIPDELRASVLAYPLLRDGLLDADDFDNEPLAALRSNVEGLVALGQFSLPEDWQPGEALATHQSDALRKMLLALVSDPRLVLVRVAEQLHRLRAAKDRPAEQKRLCNATGSGLLTVGEREPPLSSIA